MYERVNPDQNLGSYAAQIVETLLRDMAFALHKTLNSPNGENIHDLRTLCLRLRHSLRLFAKLFPQKPVRKIRRRLCSLQDLLAEVRTCDVAREVLAIEGIASAAGRDRKKLGSALDAERRSALRPLRVRLRKMQRSDTLQRWRTRLLAAS